MTAKNDKPERTFIPGQLTRRSFIERAVVLSGGLGFSSLLLQACGGSDDDDNDEVEDDGANVAPTAQMTATTEPEEDETAPTENTASPDDATDDGEPTAGGTYTHGSPQEPDRIWGPITGLTVSSEISMLVNATLVMIDENLEFVPSLVEEVPTIENGGISEDGLTYTFKLLPDVHWHDGEVFTSEDVKFTYEVIMMEGVDVRGRVGWDQISSVETPDEATVVVQFESIDAPFLNRIAAVGILPEHILGGLDAQAINEHEWFRAPVGLGPFIFKEWVSGSHIIMEKNPDYFKPGLPYLDQVIYSIIPDANTLVNQLENADIDTRMRLSNQDVEVVKDFSNVEVVSVPSVTPWVLWINNARPYFDDKRARQALALGFDKVALTQELLKDLVEPAAGLISPLSWAYNPDIPDYGFDPEKAAELLDEAGWAVGSDGIREKDGQKFSFELINIAGEQERVQVLSFIQAQWRDIGVEAEISLVDVGTMWGNALPNRDYDMAYSYSGRTADPDMSTHYLSPDLGSTTNFAGYSNPDVDELLLNALQTIDQDERQELYYEVQKIVKEDEPYIFVYWLANHTAMNTRLKGYRPAPGYVEFWNASEWWIKE